jgi:hypothetical protein
MSRSSLAASPLFRRFDPSHDAFQLSQPTQAPDDQAAGMSVASRIDDQIG